MKVCKLMIAALFVVVVVVDASTAQPPRDRERGPRGQEGGRFGRNFRVAPNPILQALDADEDGEISASEIENAVAALKKLDKNNDGKLTQDEIRPPRGRGFGGGPQGGGFGGGDFVARLMEQDENKDGKLSKEEVPERMARMFDRADANEDGFLEKKELEAMSERFGRRGGGQRRGGQGADRPRRPQRPE